jgi:hypothetical protein
MAGNEFTIDLGAFEGMLSRADTNARVAFELGLDAMVTEAKRLAPKNKSVLANSIKRGEVTGNLGTGMVGDMTASAPGAEAQEFGSGLHGERGAKYPIRPKKVRALKIPIQGSIAGGDAGFRFFGKVMHPGVQARHYLSGGVEAKLDVLTAELSAAVGKSVESK